MTATWKMPYFLSELRQRSDAVLRGLASNEKSKSILFRSKLFCKILKKTLHLFVENPLQQLENKNV
jgi:hypothetical protein